MTNTDFRLPENLNPGRIALIAGAIGLGLSAAGYFVDAKQFYHSYLTAFVYWTTIGLGGLFFSLLHHLTNATWSTVLRRFSESLMVTLPLMIILFIPVLFGMHDLYHWTHADAVAHDPLLQSKAPYLNTPFFIIRTVVYFAIWFVLGRALYKRSISQDQGDTSRDLLTKMRQISAPGMLLFGFTLTFAAFDWLMSLDPHWYSTIFGVYIFSGTLLAVLAFILVVALYLRRNNVLTDAITPEHYHDLGKLLFGFTVFWAYISFSQYFLIWYGNIPEETIFYLHRWGGHWKTISLLIVFGHFVAPFLILATRAAKRNLKLLKVVAFWMLFMHFVDLHWVILPTLHKHGFHFSWIDITTFVGVGGIFLYVFWRNFSAHALIPVNDPKLKDSLKFVNV